MTDELIVKRANKHRVPPRRIRPKRSVWRRTIWHILKYGTFFSVILVIVVTVTVNIARHFRLLSAESLEVRKARQELASLKKENAELERRIAYLKTPRGRAQAARKLGYVKPGEIIIVLPENVQKSVGR
jgi:cell division protein FtsB